MQLGGRSDPRSSTRLPELGANLVATLAGLRSGAGVAGGEARQFAGRPQPSAGQLPGARLCCQAPSCTPILPRAMDRARKDRRHLTWTATISRIVFKLRTAGERGRPSGGAEVPWGGRNGR